MFMEYIKRKDISQVKLFVYGSCKRNFFNHERFNFHKMPFLGEHSLKGWMLVNLGQYPGLVQAPTTEDEVKGEIYEIDQSGEDYLFLSKVEKGAGYKLELVDNFENGEDALYAFRYNYYNGEEPKVPEGNWLE